MRDRMKMRFFQHQFDRQFLVTNEFCLANMDLLRRIEEDIDNMEKETKRKYPTIALAAGQAKLGLQRLKQSYVAEVMNKSKSEDSAAPSLAQFRSSDVCSPYVIA